MPSSESKFPSFCLRGVGNEFDLTANGLVHSSLFSFSKQSALNPNFKEISINWQDDDESVSLLHQALKTDGSKKYKYGVAKFLTNDIDLVAAYFLVIGSFKYERNKLESNPYHGNLLLSNAVKKRDAREISALLASKCIILPSPE